MNPSIEEIRDGNSLLAIIVYRTFCDPGIHFFTADELSQQLAYMNHPAGKIIDAHVHNPIPRQVSYTQEVLFIRTGRLRVDFYSEAQQYIESRELGSGDVILLVSGGHGFEVLQDIEMFEVKQGPHVGEADKSRFAGVDMSNVVFQRANADSDD